MCFYCQDDEVELVGVGCVVVGGVYEVCGVCIVVVFDQFDVVFVDGCEVGVVYEESDVVVGQCKLGVYEFIDGFCVDDGDFLYDSFLDIVEKFWVLDVVIDQVFDVVDFDFDQVVWFY